MLQSWKLFLLPFLFFQKKKKNWLPWHVLQFEEFLKQVVVQVIAAV